MRREINSKKNACTSHEDVMRTISELFKEKKNKATYFGKKMALRKSSTSNIQNISTNQCIFLMKYLKKHTFLS
jgi:molybdopterin-biosynthesis enzyme MoeA-like protein